LNPITTLVALMRALGFLCRAVLVVYDVHLEVIAVIGVALFTFHALNGSLDFLGLLLTVLQIQTTLLD
jgi:hypothetical protein